MFRLYTIGTLTELYWIMSRVSQPKLKSKLEKYIRTEINISKTYSISSVWQLMEGLCQENPILAGFFV